jgi:DNA (cytosine-5)-methyltransferase 1
MIGKLMNFIDLFAGIGGFHIAMHRLGANCVFASEIDKNARITYQENMYALSPELFDLGNYNDDILKITEPKTQIPNFDILCAGFPCQPFSQAGHKRGFHEAQDDRGNMFFRICSIIEAKMPKAFFLENVRNILKHDDCKTFETIQRNIEDLGYTFHHQVIKASDYGLPQLRPRVFMVGFRKDNPAVEMPSFNFPNKIPLRMTMSDVWEGQCSREVGFTLRVGGRGSGIHDRRNWDAYLVDGIERRLSSIQGKRMMGLPEDFIFPVSETQALKQLGNSVAVNAVQATAAQIIDYIEENEHLFDVENAEMEVA